MKWKKLGKIFDPGDHYLPNNCRSFAQSPQALVFENHVRIYFSTREQDASGKFISHIAYVDMDPALSEVISVSEKPVIGPGKLGTFDEHGIFPISPLRDGNKIVAYTCGWSRRVSVSVETSTGLVYSDDDGMTFYRKSDGPVFSSGLHEPFLVGDSFVRKSEDKYHMWYIYGTRWIQNEVEETARVYKIGHAYSDDGIHWERTGRQIIEDVLNEDECQALPTVLYHDGKYHMYFCFREAIGFRDQPGKGYRLGYAFSKDGIEWTRDDSVAGISLSQEGWDSEMMCYPHIFKCQDKVYLLYNGNKFGKDGFGLAVLEETHA